MIQWREGRVLRERGRWAGAVGVTASEWARSRRLAPRPDRTRSTAVRSSTTDGGPTIASASTCSGTSYEPGAPALTAPWMRDSRNARGAPRSMSRPTTYHQPPRLVRVHGSRCRSETSPSGLR